MNNAPPTPAARLTLVLFFLLMALGVPALAAAAFWPTVAGWGGLTVIPLLAYETLVINLGLVAFPDYRRRYLEYIIRETATLGLRAALRGRARTLELDRLYVPLYVDARFINQTPHNLLKMVPSDLRSGDHTLWDFLAHKNLASQNLVIVGEPGSGKSTLLQHVAWSLAMRRPGVPPNCRWQVPIWLSLREHADAIRENPHLPLPRVIADHLARRQAPLPPLGWFEAQLEAGNCLILLDGLNEIADPQMRPRLRTWVKGCLASHPRNRFIISSRLRDYGAAPLADLLVLEVRPFGTEQIEQFARRWRSARLGGELPAAPEELRAAFDVQPALRALVTNPLLLTLLAGLPQKPEAWPTRRAELYAAALKKVPGSRRLPAAQQQRLLQWLAYQLMCARRHEIAPAEALTVVGKLLLALEVKGSGAAVLKRLADVTGALVKRANGSYAFAHLALQEYLAAAHLAENPAAADLAAQVGDLWWHETLRLYAAQTDATAVVTAALSDDKPSGAAIELALECLEETPSSQVAASVRCAATVRETLDGEDAERRRRVAEALLRLRLRRLAGRGSGVVLDETLVTCAEYQLFLDEQRAEGLFFQPDHWLAYRFAAGEGQQPVLGVRTADAAAFCAWLSEREPGEWIYRLPTAREVRDLARPAEAPAGQGYWTASSAGERGGRQHVIFELAWSDASRMTGVAEERVLRAMREDLARDLTQRKLIDSPSDEACNRTLAEALNISRELDHSLDMARDPTHDLESAQALASEIAATLALDLGLDVGYEFERARDRERNLGYDLSLTREPDPGLDAEAIQLLEQARDRARDRLPERLRPRLAALDLAQTELRAWALKPKLERLPDPDCELALKLDKILTHNMTLALDRDLDRDLALAIDSDRALANALALSLNRAYALKLGRARDRAAKLLTDPEREADRPDFEQVAELIRDKGQPDAELLAALLTARDLALPLDMDLTLMLELARAHARDRERASLLAKTLAQARDLARDSDRSRNRALARLVLLLNAILTLPAAPKAEPNAPANSPQAVVDVERQQLSALHAELYIDFVSLEDRARGTGRPFEGIRLVRARRATPPAPKATARGR